jgi:hypothetical protein
MLVTGVQAVGAKGVGGVQVAAVDPKETWRAAPAVDSDRDASGGARRNGATQPVVFPRKGVPLDQRPVALRHHHASTRYRADGGESESDAA